LFQQQEKKENPTRRVLGKRIGIFREEAPNTGLMEACPPHRMEIRWDTDMNVHIALHRSFLRT